MTPFITGLHHVSTIAKGAADNVAFYTRLLGLRLVKRTINFDSPSHYHLYYGDAAGTPGTLITFFPEASNRPGERGVGEVEVTQFAVPPGGIAYWRDRLRGAMVSSTIESVGGIERLSFRDADQTRLEIVETDRVLDAAHAPPGGVPREFAITGLAAVTLVVKTLEPTARFLIDVLGLTASGQMGDRWSFTLPDGSAVEIVVDPAAEPALLGYGSVHHVAFRVPDDAAQARVQAAVEAAGITTTGVRDRTYFRSIYFREPGGVIFEIATDGPGFAVDEPEAHLGETLMLPAWAEKDRATIEAGLKPLTH